MEQPKPKHGLLIFQYLVAFILLFISALISLYVLFTFILTIFNPSNPYFVLGLLFSLAFLTPSLGFTVALYIWVKSIKKSLKAIEEPDDSTLQ